MPNFPTKLMVLLPCQCTLGINWTSVKDSSEVKSNNLCQYSLVHTLWLAMAGLFKGNVSVTWQ
jgi:hypothetical protein